ncbi:hypothetical protein TNCV_306911 [Trichonephila clavipes]|nr:hypothetical protein TNCV_306911 [Trichonephila clavipes]
MLIESRKASTFRMVHFKKWFGEENANVWRWGIQNVHWHFVNEIPTTAVVDTDATSHRRSYAKTDFVGFSGVSERRSYYPGLYLPGNQPDARRQCSRSKIWPGKCRSSVTTQVNS